MAATPKRAAIQASVLEATEGLLAGGASFADLGVERIATAAGISRTAFYFYFKDKRELLMRLTEEVAGSLYEEADAWFSGGADDLGVALANVGRLYEAHGPLLKAIVEVSTYDDEVAASWRALVGRFVEATRQRIEQDGVPGVDPHATAFVLCWMVERAYYQQMVQGAPVADMVGAVAGVWQRSIYGT